MSRREGERRARYGVGDVVLMSDDQARAFGLANLAETMTVTPPISQDDDHGPEDPGKNDRSAAHALLADAGAMKADEFRAAVAASGLVRDVPPTKKATIEALEKIARGV